MDPRMQAMIDQLRGTPEATATLLSGMVADPLAGLHGVGQGITSLLRGRGVQGSLQDAAGRVESTRNALTYEPRTQSGQRQLQALGRTMEPVADVLERPAGWVAENVSPEAGASLAGLAAVVDPTKGAAKVSRAARTVARSKPVLAAQGLEPDIVRSMVTDPKYKPGVPVADIEAAKANRAQYRQEPSTLPKPATEMTDQDWVDFGNQYGVDFSQSPMRSLGVSDLKTKREIMVPGGLEGKFTVPDLFRIKANNFDPGALGQDLHNQLMAKFLRTYERPQGSDAVDIFNDLNFSLMSPNAPLTQNEFLAQRFRLKDQGELAALADRAPEALFGEPGALRTAMDQESGVGAASRGGLGVGGTADYGQQAALAALLQDNPEVFRPGAGETLRDVGFRVMNQVPGLSVKTASLGIPWTDLANANTSAVDLHMIRHGYPRLMAENPDFARRMGELRGKNPSLSEEAAAIDIIGGQHPGGQYRMKGGELNPGLPPYLSPDKLAFEPESWVKPNEFYNQIMGYVDESRGANPAHALFPEQWRKWDVYRGRVEPHEMAHPDWRKLPRQSFSELQNALTAHKEAGYMGQPSRAGTLYPSDVDTQPVPKPMDWRRMYYGRATPEFTGALAAGSLGALALSRALREQPPEEQAAAP